MVEEHVLDKSAICRSMTLKEYEEIIETVASQARVIERLLSENGLLRRAIDENCQTVLVTAAPAGWYPKA